MQIQNRTIRHSFPIIPTPQATEKFTHLLVSISHNKNRSCYILSITPAEQENGFTRTTITGHSDDHYYGNIGNTKRYSDKELTTLAEKALAQAADPQNPIIAMILKAIGHQYKTDSTQHQTTVTTDAPTTYPTTYPAALPSLPSPPDQTSAIENHQSSISSTPPNIIPFPTQTRPTLTQRFPFKAKP